MGDRTKSKFSVKGTKTWPGISRTSDGFVVNSSILPNHARIVSTSKQNKRKQQSNWNSVATTTFVGCARHAIWSTLGRDALLESRGADLLPDNHHRRDERQQQKQRRRHLGVAGYSSTAIIYNSLVTDPNFSIKRRYQRGIS